MRQSRRRSITVLAVLMALFASTHSSAQSETQIRQPFPDLLPDVFVVTDTCNTYVIRDGDAALLIDFGAGGVMDHLAGIGVKRVDWICFTHHHREQCQGIARADRTTTKVAAPQAEQELFEQPLQFRKWYPKLGDKYSVYGASYARPPRIGIPLDQTLEADAAIKWRGYEIRCLGTPGHSPGSVTYVVQLEGKTVALTGDVIHDGAKMTTWFDSEWDYGFAKGVDTLIESVEKLIEVEPNLILPAHGPAIRNSREQLATYRDKLKTFRASYVRGYNVFDSTEEERDPISMPTAVPLISQVTPHLYKLSHQTKGKNFAIIISDSGRGLILDAGLFSKEMLEEIIVGLRAHMGLKQIDAFWISHMHGDHFLLGPTLKEKYGAEAWTLDRIVDRCENPRRYDYAALVSAYGDGFDGMRIERPFRDGEAIEWEGYRIQVDWMPGQTEFGCSLWLDIDGKRVVFTGDNLFGSSADPQQNGHEAVVARNSAIFEEGYLYGSRYLKDLKPDIVMGSHSYVMPEPAAFLERYHAWAQEIIRLYKDLLPDSDYEYQFDPYWVSAYPYRVDFTEQTAQTVAITVRNFRNTTQRHRIELKLPAGMTAEPPLLDGLVERESRHTYQVKLKLDPKQATVSGLRIVAFDITLDDTHHGELFDFLVRLPAPEKATSN
ncbi:MAG: MBL fold metallo-hydrolase [Planctomycetota bacterium]|jgi:glyoxylase-like metal-dependent hydrolase (beta-lactamase superfamily II)